MTESPKEAARRLAHPAINDGFVPEALHEYRDVSGAALYWRIRAKHPDGRKWIRPMKLNGRGFDLGEPDFAGSKPLYALDRIAATDQAIPIYVTEGEKAADALLALGAIATTSGGADSADRADWTPLRGRECRLWRDNDEPGIEYAGNVAAILLRLGCRIVAIDVDRLGLPPRADAWDWARRHENATPADLEALPRLTPSAPAQWAAEADSDRPRWPDAMSSEALHGIAGEFVRTVEPNTEADPAAILVQFLVAFGALVGRGPHYRVEGDEHHANVFALLVGVTGKGRKGTSWGRTKQVFARVEGWKPPVSGLSSGEGLKYNVRDASEETKENKSGEHVTAAIDDGVVDKRLLVVESEFASALRNAQKPGNTLSATIREAWDSGTLRTLTKHDPITATGAHVCIVGHITADELRAELTATDSANGFANRFLFVAVKRSKLLPFGGDQADDAELQAFAARLRERAETARSRHQITMTPEARTVWAKVYPELSAGAEGLHGAVTARAEAQVIRLALLYCLLDGAAQIDVAHLLAGLAVWQYCDDTARCVFGESLGDRTADEILRRLRRGDVGLTRTEIRDIFKRNLSGDRIGAALELLRDRGKATVVAERTDGRPTEVWRATK